VSVRLGGEGEDARINARGVVALGALILLGIAATLSYIQALSDFTAPYELPLEVVSVETLGEGNASRASFTTGEEVRILVTVEKATRYFSSAEEERSFIGSTTYMLIVAVLDGRGRPLLFDSSVRTISPGEARSTAFNYNVTAGSPRGECGVRAMAWSGWLPSGSALAPEAGEATFTIR